MKFFTAASICLTVFGALSQAAAVEKKDVATDIAKEILADIEAAASCAGCEVCPDVFLCPKSLSTS